MERLLAFVVRSAKNASAVRRGPQTSAIKPLATSVYPISGMPVTSTDRLVPKTLGKPTRTTMAQSMFHTSGNKMCHVRLAMPCGRVSGCNPPASQSPHRAEHPGHLHHDNQRAGCRTARTKACSPEAGGGCSPTTRAVTPSAKVFIWYAPEISSGKL